MSVYSERVKAGAALLDRKWPGWTDEIDLQKLNLAQGPSCILGQMYGRYTDGARVALGLPSHVDAPDTTMVALGFLVLGSGGKAFKERYARLTEAWKVFIKRRRARR